MPDTTNCTILRLGTRGSLLARAQSRLVADLLERHHPDVRVELTLFRTSGDQIAERPLYELGGKGLFTKELEQALLAGKIDLAVHSFKDMPVTMPLVEQSALVVAAVPPREDPRDVLISAGATSLRELAPGARIGSGSLRRRAQILTLRPDVRVEPIRGNIDTRLRKLREGQFDAIVLAMAGLKRAGLLDLQIMHVIDPAEILPAPGQGALALQCRRDEGRMIELLSVVNDPATATCVGAERELVRLLDGDCHSPIGALAELASDGLHLRAAVGRRDGRPPVVVASASGLPDDPERVANQAFEMLSARGVRGLLQGR